MPTLAEIRAKLAAQDTKTKTTQTSTGDNSIYAHWNIPVGTTATVRFLPDGNPNNTYFWVERQLIKLTFNGIVGNPDARRVDVSVPCIEMYDDRAACPIHKEIRPWYKDDNMKELANKYWKKRSYLFQGFVRSNPMEDEAAVENPIRRFIISPQIFSIIKSSLLDPELDDLPTDYLRGLDFNIKKTSKGDYSDYTTSVWSRRESALTDIERAAIEQHGLFDLGSFLPQRPGDAELKVMLEMFEASVDNQPYDPDRWAGFYRPWGMDAEGKMNSSSSTSAAEAHSAAEAKIAVKVPASFKPTVVSTAAASAVNETHDEPVVVSSTSTPTVSKPAAAATAEKTQDILAQIRARQAAKQ